MSFIIQDRIEVSVILGDFNYPLNQLNALNFLHMGSSIKLLVPTLKLSITDQAGVLDTGMLKDGLPIKVVVNALGVNESRTFSFTLKALETANTGNGTQFTIYGYGGGPNYYISSSTEGIYGTSNDVIAEIARRCGLAYEGTVTSDAQLWMPQNRRNAMFAKRVASAGYVNSESFMKSALCMDGTLRYKNLSADDPVVLTMVQGKVNQGFLPIIDHKLKISNGSNNVLMGYAARRVTQSQERPGIDDSLTLMPDSRTMMLNAEINEQVSRGNTMFSPIDVGNVHDYYERAIYQNRRISNLYSVGCDFLTTYPSGLQLLDRIEFVAERDTGTVNDGATGKYVTTSHAILIQGPNYYEKIEGYRQGTNWR